METEKIFLIIRHMQPIYLKKDTNYLTNNFQRKIKTVQNGYFYGNVELIFLVDTARLTHAKYYYKFIKKGE